MEDRRHAGRLVRAFEGGVQVLRYDLFIPLLRALIAVTRPVGFLRAVILLRCRWGLGSPFVLDGRIRRKAEGFHWDRW